MNASNIEPELNSLFTKLSAEIANDRTEIEIREKRIKKNEVLLQAVRGALGVTNTVSKATGYGKKSDTVRAAINQMTKPRFTQSDIEAEIKKLNPDMEINRERIRSALWTLQHRKELIKQVTQGNNRQSAEFEKIPSATIGTKVPQRSIPPPRPTPPQRPVVVSPRDAENEA